MLLETLFTHLILSSQCIRATGRVKASHEGHLRVLKAKNRCG